MRGIGPESHLYVIQDYVQAHFWLNLAASQATGDWLTKLSEYRDNLASRMTSAQVAEAQRLAREWKPRGKSEE